MRLPLTSFTWPGSKGSIILCSAGMRRIHLSDLIVIATIVAPSTCEDLPFRRCRPRQELGRISSDICTSRQRTDMPGMPAVCHRLLLAASIALSLTTCAIAADNAAAPAPLQPQPAAAALQLGLQLLYFEGDFKHVDNMPKTSDDLAKGRRGAPVANLASSSEDGKMWGIASGAFYGAHLSGLI